MAGFEDLLSRGSMSMIEYEAWAQSEAGQLVLGRSTAQKIAHLLMWPVYLFEGLLALVLSIFQGRQGSVRLPDDWMLGHRGIPPAHMTPRQLAHAVQAAEGRQFFWLIISTIIGIALMSLVIYLFVKAEHWSDPLFFIFLIFSLLGGFLAGVATRYHNAHRNMIVFKRTAAYVLLQGTAHGQSRDIPLMDETVH